MFPTQIVVSMDYLGFAFYLKVVCETELYFRNNHTGYERGSSLVFFHRKTSAGQACNLEHKLFFCERVFESHI